MADEGTRKRYSIVDPQNHITKSAQNTYKVKFTVKISYQSQIVNTILTIKLTFQFFQ